MVKAKTLPIRQRQSKNSKQKDKKVKEKSTAEQAMQQFVQKKMQQNSTNTDVLFETFTKNIELQLKTTVKKLTEIKDEKVTFE